MKIYEGLRDRVGVGMGLSLYQLHYDDPDFLSPADHVEGLANLTDNGYRVFCLRG